MEENKEEPTITVKGLSPEELVSPRFWEMRKFMVDFGQACINGSEFVERGDMVMVTDGTAGMNGPWIVMGLDDDGFIILGNGSGQMMRCPSWSLPVCVSVLSRVSEALG